jgi:hypothetical protein
MRLPDRTPVLVDTRAGDGRLLVAGFAPTPDWSNLPLKPEFVPLMLRAVAHLQRQAAASASSAVQPHEPAVIRVTDRWPDAQVECIDPTGHPTAIPLRRDGRQLVGAMLATDRKGFYRFVVTPRAPAAAAAPERVELGFAVNLDSGADFTSLTEPQLRDLLKPVSIAYLRGTHDDPVLKGQLTQKREIWRTLIWATFLVIGVEFLLSTLRPSKSRGVVPGARGPELDVDNDRPLRRAAGRVAAMLTGAGARD